MTRYPQSTACWTNVRIYFFSEELHIPGQTKRVQESEAKNAILDFILFKPVDLTIRQSL